MRPISEISINDEIANSFSYTSESQLVIGFLGYFDLEAGCYQDKSCSLIIEQWASASVEVDEVIKTKKQPLEQGLGIISMVFALTLTGDLLEAHVLTLDNRYLLLKFTRATVGYVFP
jgi:hypothetical protein